MKKLLAILLAVLMLVSLTACGKEFYNPEDYTETELEVIQSMEKYYLIPGAMQAFGDTCTYEGTVIKNITGAGKKYSITGTGYALCEGKEFTCKFGYEFEKKDANIYGQEWFAGLGYSKGYFGFA